MVGGDADATSETVVRELEEGGHTVDCTLIAPDKLQGALDAALSDRPDALIVGGGDGTVRSAAIRLIGTDTPLGVLPLGTINRLARDLGMPLATREAAAALADPEVKAIDVAEVNGKPFLCNSVLGAPIRFSTERKKLRGKPARERLVGYVTALADMMRTRRRVRVVIDDGDQRHRVRALSMVVSCNGYAEEASLMLRRARLDGGELSAYVSRHASGWGMAQAAVRALLGRIEGDPEVLRVSSPSLQVRLRRSTATVSNDGEIEVFDTPLIYTIKPRALNVLVPRQAA